jgi:hypothetical protein
MAGYFMRKEVYLALDYDAERSKKHMARIPVSPGYLTTWQ